jgi:hypothetical protein
LNQLDHVSDKLCDQYILLTPGSKTTSLTADGTTGPVP